MVINEEDDIENFNSDNENYVASRDDVWHEENLAFQISTKSSIVSFNCLQCKLI